MLQGFWCFSILVANERLDCNNDSGLGCVLRNGWINSLLRLTS
nr:MAG TPA: hypothetical protein [Caudoviricetes sp.]